MAIRNGRADPLRDGGVGTPMGCSRGLRLPARRPAGPDGVVLKVRPGLDMLASQHGIQLRPDPVVIRTTAIIDRWIRRLNGAVAITAARSRGGCRLIPAGAPPWPTSRRTWPEQRHLEPPHLEQAELRDTRESCAANFP